MIQFFPECKLKSISGWFIHQAGIVGVKYFSTFCDLILVDSKGGEILMPNDLIALGFCLNKSTYFGGNVASYKQGLIG